MFKGFTEETSDFLWGLSFNNERTWFLAHKEQFERCLNAPIKALAEDCLDIMRERFPDAEFKLHVSRIYRDARRLFGRGPYKDHMWFSLKRGDDSGCGPDFWFEIGAAGYEYGMGYSCPSPALMEAFRRSIDANPAGFERLAGKIEKSGRYTIGGAEYKRPKGNPGGCAQRWYNRRSLWMSHREDNGGAELTEDLPRIICDGFSELMDMFGFLSIAARAAEAEAREAR